MDFEELEGKIKSFTEKMTRDWPFESDELLHLVRPDIAVHWGQTWAALILVTGRVLTHEEAAPILAMLDTFYRRATPEDIEQWNEYLKQDFERQAEKIHLAMQSMIVHMDNDAIFKFLDKDES